MESADKAEAMEEEPGDRTAPPSTTSSHVQEISQQNIKNRINEVITEIEREVEHELQEDSGHSETEQEMNLAEKSASPPPPAETLDESRSTIGDLSAGTPEASGAAQSHPDSAKDSAKEPEPDNNQMESDDVPTSQPAVTDAGAGQSDPSDQGQDKSEDQSPTLEGELQPMDASGGDNEHKAPEKPAEIQSISVENGYNGPEPIQQDQHELSQSKTQESSTAPAAEPDPTRFCSPFSSTATSSLPRGWKTDAAAHQDRSSPQAFAPGEHRRAPEAQTSNTLPRGWPAQAGADPPRRVHFAAEPEVQTFEDAPGAPQGVPVQMRAKSAASGKPRPLSAPAAPQLYAIPNMAARPFGWTEALIVTPVDRASPLPPAGEVRASPLPPAGEERSKSAAVADNSIGSTISGELAPELPVAPPAEPSAAVPAKVFVPATDEPVIPLRKKTMFVDSAFFSPKVHPTWEQQVQLAKKISSSLSDASNQQSRGQSMYERRKKRSVKWVHQEMPPQLRHEVKESRDSGGGSQAEVEDACPSPQLSKSKPLLQLVMNPHGHVYDLNALTKQGWVIDSKGGLSPEICSDLIKDLNSPNGKGAQIFAKRKKKAERWVVDEEHREPRRPEEAPAQPPPPAVPQKQLQPTPPPAQQLPRRAPPQPAPPQPQPLQPVQLQPQPLQPVALQSLYEPLQQPHFPSGGVYAPRTAHGWGAGPASETKHFKAVPAFNTDTNRTRQSASEQSRLIHDFNHSEENKENVETETQDKVLSGLSREDADLQLAELEFQRAARQLQANRASDATDLPMYSQEHSGQYEPRPIDDAAMEFNPDIPAAPEKDPVFAQKPVSSETSASISSKLLFTRRAENAPAKPPRADFKSQSGAADRDQDELRNVQARLRHTSPPIKHQTEQAAPAEEVTGVWGRVSAIRHNFDSAKAGLSSKGPRAATMAVPNKFHQMPLEHNEPAAAAGDGPAGSNGKQIDVEMEMEEGDQPDVGSIWGNYADETAVCTATAGSNEEQAEIGAEIGFQAPINQSDVKQSEITQSATRKYESFGQSTELSKQGYQNAGISRKTYQSKNTQESTQLYFSTTDGTTSYLTKQEQPMSAEDLSCQPMSSVDTFSPPVSLMDTSSGLMFQCEVGRVETRVDETALKNCIQSGEFFLYPGEPEPRPSSAPPAAVPAAQEMTFQPQPAAQQECTNAGISRAEKLQNRQSWANYNTAPRGWGNMDAFYRPITFTQSLLSL